MKKLFLTSVFLFLVFAFGCQESSITNPPDPDATQLQDNDKSLVDIPVAHGFIKINCCDLEDPVNNCLCGVIGEVEYYNQILPIDDLNYFHVKVNVSMSSFLYNHGGLQHPYWEIKGKSEDISLINRYEDNPTLLRKTYKISNRPDIELCVTYEVSLRVVEVKDIKLNACFHTNYEDE